MRVPTMSEGTRSGVNWMRENVPPTTVAKLRTASVLATPGTPSSRMWPLASRPTISCSTMCSWPTMTRCTWLIASPSRRDASAGSMPGRFAVAVEDAGEDEAADEPEGFGAP